MTQNILNAKLVQFIDLMWPEKEDMPAKRFCCFKPKPVVSLKDILKKDILKGQCFGWAICHAEMDLIGNMAWWELALHAVASWDGTWGSLEQNIAPLDTVEVKAPDNDKRRIYTLRDIFTEVLNYVVTCQNEVLSGAKIIADKSYDDRLKPLDSFDFLGVHDSKKIIDHQVVITFTEDQLLEALNEEVIAGKICIIVALDHAIRIAYKDKKWLIYDANYDHSRVATMHVVEDSKASAANEIIKRLKSELLEIHISSCYDPTPKLIVTPVTWDSFIAKPGFLSLIARNYPNDLALFFRKLKPVLDEKLREALFFALQFKNYHLWNGLHTLGGHSADALLAFLRLFDDEDEPFKKLLASLWLEKNDKGETAKEVVEKYAPVAAHVISRLIAPPGCCAKFFKPKKIKKARVIEVEEKKEEKGLGSIFPG